jgi:hypothetical protein
MKIEIGIEIDPVLKRTIFGKRLKIVRTAAGFKR